MSTNSVTKRAHLQMASVARLVFGLALLGGPHWIVAAENTATNQEIHWSLKPITRPSLPAIPNRKWKTQNPIDHFVLAKLAEKRLSPSGEAPRRVLIRRLYFDLLGMPPTPEEVAAFEADSRHDAYAQLVERLLHSSHYGERWARHWLDVVRFAETQGFEMNQPRPNAWPYRDYVIHAFNEDKPFDRFILEQFAGDLFGEDAATGFLVGGPWDQVKSPDVVLTANQRADELHDMVSTTGSAFLGLTVGCARCHDHKFDPIPQEDYYAIKACLAGVQHGERKLVTPDLSDREQKLEQARKDLVRAERELEQFEPLAFAGQVQWYDTELSFGSRAVLQFQPATRMAYAAGKQRGAKEDAGDADRLPNFTTGCLSWIHAAGKDLFAWEPGFEGRFRLYLSWGCGLEGNAQDALFLMDQDGDLTTTNDQTVIARVDERPFAGGAGPLPETNVWSGFFNAGAWDLSVSNKIVLRGGHTDGIVTAGVIALVQETTNANDRSSGRFLRAMVNPRRNVEHFAPTAARRLRFTITRTTDAEPCIDELEVYSAEAEPRNVALASAGTKASASSVFPNSDIHRLEHINDGKHGNSRSWISNERGKGWVELEFPETVTINRVVWGRDREQQFSDRLATEYRIEVTTGAGSSDEWQLVASSRDRLPFRSGAPVGSELTAAGRSETEATLLKEKLAQRGDLETRVKELSRMPMVYSGVFTNTPEPMHRLRRGDPMQEREVVEPRGLSTIPVEFKVMASLAGTGADAHSGGASLTVDQQRRLALAKWIADPANPLPARVIVNRLWQYHFGEGLVGTPSDFGKNGARPTHPELLDWLASELVHPTETAPGDAEKGLRSPFGLTPWSLKHIQRLIVNSAAYRQKSEARPECAAVDSAARFLWRFPPRRLEAEPLRDSILAITGKLDLREGGPGFSAFEPNDNYVRVYEPRKEFGTNEWRRMIYMTKVRMQQDATFGAFDCPDGGQIAPKRMRSITPLQALNLLNSQFMVQQSELFAERLEREIQSGRKAQVRRAFELVFGRGPDRAELDVGTKLISQFGLPVFCRALFNSNEFVFME